MKANHIPRKERILNRLSKLRMKSDIWYYKPPNPYPFCSGCHKTNVQISIDGEHYKGCVMAGIEKEIEYYEGLLKEINGSLL